MTESVRLYQHNSEDKDKQASEQPASARLLALPGKVIMMPKRTQRLRVQIKVKVNLVVITLNKTQHASGF